MVGICILSILFAAYRSGIFSVILLSLSFRDDKLGEKGLSLSLQDDKTEEKDDNGKDGE